MYNIILLMVVGGVVFSSGQTQDLGNDYHCNPTFHFHQNYNGPEEDGRNFQPISVLQTLPRDCTEVRERGNSKSGQYVISPQDDGPSFRVYCDMETGGGNWTVFQRREDGSIDFYLNWADYENGFGNTNSEHWLGNEKIHRITAQGHYELRIDMADFEGNTRYAKYNNFRIGNAATNYKLIIGTYIGDAGDSLSGASNQAFTTKDRDLDTHEVTNCANIYKGGWWYTACHSANLNGLYLGGVHESYADGIEWNTWKGHNYSLKLVEMKIRIAP